MSGQETVAVLPDSARSSFKEPLGPVFTDAGALLSGVEGRVIAVGDAVTHHLLAADCRPAVSVVDGLTEREPVAESVATTLADLEPRIALGNEAGTLSAALIEAVAAGIEAADGRVLVVDGEEDLATLPAVLLAPEGWAVVYGQPGEGMVRVDVDRETKARVRGLAGELETTERFWDLVE